ncbi:CAAX protease self-immunity [Pedobacter suwonensis]|uniref:CAAX protease self-immunity n=1 Tax=Pedobacter suwonensis TaxID=332999 RepID=A0A1I0ST47_9SPHI|nr:CPBP family glutamic-type intramembrane protease [Pedobacter suwonensis]SFA42674.1 CAAX protease self-immunity [Pedobacter suwonensis]
MGIYYTLLHFEIIDEYVEKFDILKKLGLTVALLIACILAPLLEESLFRWHLRSKYLSIYFVCFTLALIADYFINSPFLKWPIYTFFFFISLIIRGYFKRMDIRKKVVFQRQSFGYLFYYSAIIFGLIHLTNIKDLTLSDPVFIIFIISQFFSGLSMGYMRIKYGLIYSILLHSIFNFIMILLEFFFS